MALSVGKNGAWVGLDVAGSSVGRAERYLTANPAREMRWLVRGISARTV